MASFSNLKSAIYDREERKQHYQAHIRGLNAYDRHKKFLNDYVKYYGKDRPSEVRLPVKTDQDALREGYRFIRTEEDDLDTSWEQRLVKRYYDKLFKEYCIADMSRYKTGKIGLRWRTEKEVISGKGQFICGNKHCDAKDGLASYEVNFSYFEAGETKQALIKLVACDRCAEKLHYRRNREKQLESQEKEECKRKRDEKIRNYVLVLVRETLRNDGDTDDEHTKTGDKKKTKEDVSDYRGKECSRNRRKRSSGDDSTDEEPEKSRERKRKGKRGSTSGADHKHEDDDNFDEFLEGMFP